MASVQLARWPTGEWDAGENPGALMAADRHFEAALRLQPDNVSAHYYLGLSARRRRDFEMAATHLAQALAADPGHRGIVKTLGYSYVWLGRFDAAQPLLTQIPEASRELEVYSWWWGQQLRADLATNARRMRALLEP